MQKLTPNGIQVSIVGFPVSEGRDPNPEGGIAAAENILSKINKDDYSIFLYHYPDLIEEVVKQNVDLYCAGHTHGGQVRLPSYGALVTLSKFGKRYEASSLAMNLINEPKIIEHDRMEKLVELERRHELKTPGSPSNVCTIPGRTGCVSTR